MITSSPKGTWLTSPSCKLVGGISYPSGSHVEQPKCIVRVKQTQA